MEKPTEKQLNYIKIIEEEYIGERNKEEFFRGKTKKEASEWLSKYAPGYKKRMRKYE